MTARLLRGVGQVLVGLAILLSIVDWPTHWLFLNILPGWLRALVCAVLIVGGRKQLMQVWRARQDARRSRGAEQRAVTDDAPRT